MYDNMQGVLYMKYDTGRNLSYMLQTLSVYSEKKQLA